MPGKSKATLWAIGISVALTAVAYMNPETSKHMWNPETCTGDPPWAAFDAAKEAVRQQLIAPSTASFAGDERYRPLPGCSFDITGKVDAQNGFGAMLRSGWKVHVVRSGSSDRKWNASSTSLNNWRSPSFSLRAAPR
jgi:hypothetical protein